MFGRYKVFCAKATQGFLYDDTCRIMAVAPTYSLSGRLEKGISPELTYRQS